MSTVRDCYECGNKANFAALDYPFEMYCLPCVKEMKSMKGKSNG